MIVCFSCLPNASIVKDFRPDSVAVRKKSIRKREHASVDVYTLTVAGACDSLVCLTLLSRSQSLAFQLAFLIFFTGEAILLLSLMKSV